MESNQTTTFNRTVRLKESQSTYTRQKRLPREQAPTIAPNFSPHSAWFNESKAKEIRANLCALNASRPLHPQLTADDFTIFLDSGCINEEAQI